MLEKKDIELERAVLIGVVTKEQDEAKSKEYLLKNFKREIN